MLSCPMLLVVAFGPVFGYDYEDGDDPFFMKLRFWPWLNEHRPGGLAGSRARFLNRLIAVLEIPAPDTPQLLQRITIMEQHIVLPLKAAGIAMLLYSFYFTPWIGEKLSALEVAVESVQRF